MKFYGYNESIPASWCSTVVFYNELSLTVQLFVNAFTYRRLCCIILVSLRSNE